MLRKINIFGGPGAGKSTTASWLFSELKTRNISIEFVGEYVKSWAYQNRKIGEFDQVYFLGKQLHYEYRLLDNGAKWIITDCPVLLSGIYSEYYHKDLKISENIFDIVKKYEEKFPSINVYLNRADNNYNEEGRFQNKEQAIEVDKLILNTLKRLDFKYEIIDYNDRKKILDFVLKTVIY